MSIKSISTTAIIIAVIFITIVYFTMSWSTKNREVELRNAATAQQLANKNIKDKTWKTVAEKAQISEKYANDFSKIYNDIMDKRYSGNNDNLLFKWIQEHNPTFSTELYKDLADAIESNRAEFARVQNRLIDIKREHDNLRMKVPSKWFVGTVTILEIQIVTSTKTEKMFETGKEDDIDLFKKK